MARNFSSPSLGAEAIASWLKTTTPAAVLLWATDVLASPANVSWLVALSVCVAVIVTSRCSWSKLNRELPFTSTTCTTNGGTIVMRLDCVLALSSGSGVITRRSAAAPTRAKGRYEEPYT